MAVAQPVTYALVLAGGKVSWSATPKASLPIADGTLLSRTLDALQAIPELRTIAVVAPSELLPTIPAPFLPISASDDLWANVLKGLQALQPEPSDLLLLCAADMPFITAEAVRRFLKAAWESDADLVYLAVPLAAVQTFCGDEKVHRTAVRLRDGELTGGNLLLVRVAILPSLREWAQKAIRWRKNPIRLGSLIGWRLLWRFLVGQLSVQELERRAEQLLGCRCKAIVADLPELAFDVDKPEDYALAQRLSSRFLIG
jgi:molybdopterin-guanine dinucleotide biosynthesis protein A